MKRFKARFLKSPSFWSIIVMAIILVWSLFNIGSYKQAETDSKYLIDHDVQQYYSYLPAAFIYNDLQFKFLESDTIPDKIKRHFWVTPAKNKPDGRIVKMSIGLSYMYLPFFAAAHAYASNSSTYAANGFSLPYEFALAFSSIFFVILGMFFCRSILLNFCSEWITAFVLLTILFATNLYYYCTTEPAMSHAYLFSLYAVFIHQSWRWIQQQKWRNALWIGIVGGIIICIRPVNVLIFLFPLLYGVTSWADLMARLKLIVGHYFQLLLMVVVLLLMIVPQLLFWKLNSGEWVYYSYNDEGFFFSNPQIINGLFSYRKGWLVYTPIMVLAIVGMRWVWLRNRAWFWPILWYMSLHIYVVFSWWCWWYGGSYGARPMIETYALMMVPLALFMQHMATKKLGVKIGVSTLVVFLVYLNLVQTQQKRLGLIHWDGMTQTAYWRNFLTLHDVGGIWDDFREPNYDAAKKGMVEYGTLSNEMRFLITRNFFEPFKVSEDSLAPKALNYEDPTQFHQELIKQFNDGLVTQTAKELEVIFDNPKHKNHLNPDQIYSPELVIPYQEISTLPQITLKITAQVWLQQEVQLIQPTLVCKFREQDSIHAEWYLELEKDSSFVALPNQWNKIAFYVTTPFEEHTENFNIQILGWLRGTGNWLLDEVEIFKIEQINP